MNKLEDQLGELQELVIQELIARIQSGKATPSDIGNAIKLLKDNDITIQPRKGDPLEKLAEDLTIYSDQVVNLEDFKQARSQ